jgi:hypothetical protein
MDGSRNGSAIIARAQHLPFDSAVHPDQRRETPRRLIAEEEF